MALPTKGRVVISTTAGDLDIELYAKETPKTCRNFIALALEGYYDNNIFHRIVPGFLIQTGDKSNTGGGGESFYGDVFEDEIHPRLRFPHRGIVAMANRGKKNTNDSQFIVTLDRAEELHGKHTVFGRCVGDTIYNAVKIGESEIDDNGRPVYPPKIRSIRIVDNPFDDIVPRITAAERRAQQKAREESMKEREEEFRRRGAKKNTKLLSFGEEGDGGEEEEEEVVFKKKPMFRPDMVVDAKPSNPNLMDVPDFSSKPSTSSKPPKKSKPRESSVDITKIRSEHAALADATLTARSKEISTLESQIHKLSKRTGGGNSDSEDEDEQRKKKKKKTNYVEEELAKYKARGRLSKPKGKRKDESGLLAAMSSFRSKLQDAPAPQRSPTPTPADEEGESHSGGGIEEEEPMEVDTALDFISHRLTFASSKDAAADEERGKAERDYEVIDPRVRGAKAREEERARKEKMDEKRGKGGRRRY